MPYQTGWKSCYPCTGIWLAPDVKDTGGSCQNPIGQHDGIGAGIFYELYYFGGETEPDYSGRVQENWRCCRKCLVLFFDGNPTAGFCHAGGGHDAVGSKNYILEHSKVAFKDRYRMLINWRWCCKCQQLCQPDWLVSKDFICPSKKGAAHDTTGSGFYAIGHQQWI